MCRFDKKDMLNFFMLILPFGVTAIAGTIRAGYGWWLLLWLAYSLFFFFRLGIPRSVQSLSLLGRGWTYSAMSRQLRSRQDLEIPTWADE